MTDGWSEREAAFNVWGESLPKCVGDPGGCDGSLVGIEHEPNCPMFGKKFATHKDAFDAGWAARASAAPLSQPGELSQIVKEIISVGKPSYEESDEIGNQFKGWEAKMPRKAQWLSICAKAVRFQRASQPQNGPPAEAPSRVSAWDRYWESLDKDSQEKLASSVDSLRSWFAIAEVWASQPQPSAGQTEGK